MIKTVATHIRVMDDNTLCGKNEDGNNCPYLSQTYCDLFKHTLFLKQEEELRGQDCILAEIFLEEQK